MGPVLDHILLGFVTTALQLSSSLNVNFVERIGIFVS